MQKPAIISLTDEEKTSLLKKIESSELELQEKQMIAELVQFTAILKEKLNASEITIANLKKLFGSNSESLKKLLQTL